jgi:integrase
MVDVANQFLLEKAHRGGKKDFNASDIVYAYAVRGLLEYAGDPGFKRINIPRVMRLDNPPFLNPPDVVEIVKHAPEMTGKKVMKPSISLSHELALRFGECASIKREDFNLKTQKCRFVREKQRNPLVQVLDVLDPAFQHVKEYLEWRTRDKSPWLFATDVQRAQLSINEQKLFPNVCKNLGIDDKSGSGKLCTWHILRHTRLTWMIAQGGSIGEVAKFAGHTNVNSTLRYLNICTFYGLGVYGSMKKGKTAI